MAGEWAAAPLLLLEYSYEHSRMRRGAMIYSEDYTRIAEIILEHKCSAVDCICREIRAVPAVNEEIRKLHVEKIQSTSATQPGL